LGDFEYTTIRYAGYVSNVSVWAISGSPTTVDHCVFSDSADVGLSLQWATAFPTITNSIFRDNQRAIVVAAGGANAIIGGTSGRGSDFFANSSYAVENLGSNCINARYNYWGANDGPNDPSLTYAFEVYTDSGLTALVASTYSVSGGCCSGITSWYVSPALEYSR
jgi:hypothetical protein